jgi:AAA domain
MSLTNLISTGRVPRPQRIGVYGQNGIGKTTLAAQFPVPIFLDCEDGTTHQDVPRIHVQDTSQLFEAVRALGSEGHSYRTVVIDTIDAVEKFLRQRICQTKSVKSIEDLGYGKGWTLLREEFTALLHLFDDWLISKGLDVLVIGHGQSKKVQPPGIADSYDRYELKLDVQNSSQLKEWSDAMLFMNWDIRTQETASGRIRGVGGKDRVIHTMHAAAWDAKNRVGLPDKVEAAFEALSPLLSPVTDPVVELAKTLADLDTEHVCAFFVDRKQIVQGGSIVDIPIEYARRALKSLPKLRQAIEEFRQQSMKVEVAATKQGDHNWSEPVS